MSQETTQLKRDSTMTVTAEEGAAFLEKHGVVSDEAKTRGQQKELEKAEEPTSPKLSRTTTMAATAKEGEAILDGADLGKTRAETAKQEDEVVEEEKQEPLQRTTTMQMTAKEGQEILEANGGVVEGTRSESKKIEEAIKVSEEDKKEAETNGDVEGDEAKEEADENGANDEAGTLKRKSTMQITAEEGEEFLKKQKVSEPEEAAATEVEA